MGLTADFQWHGISAWATNRKRGRSPFLMWVTDPGRINESIIWGCMVHHTKWFGKIWQKGWMPERYPKFWWSLPAWTTGNKPPGGCPEQIYILMTQHYCKITLWYIAATLVLSHPLVLGTPLLWQCSGRVIGFSCTEQCIMEDHKELVFTPYLKVPSILVALHFRSRNWIWVLCRSGLNSKFALWVHHVLHQFALRLRSS